MAGSLKNVNILPLSGVPSIIRTNFDLSDLKDNVLFCKPTSKIKILKELRHVQCLLKLFFSKIYKSECLNLSYC